MRKGSQRYSIILCSDARCGVLSWQSPVEFTSGGRDGRVVHYDLRQQGRGGIVAESLAHSQEICGLKWNNRNEGVR